MFNRDNIPTVPNPFGSRGNSGAPQEGPPSFSRPLPSGGYGFSSRFFGGYNGTDMHDYYRAYGGAPAGRPGQVPMSRPPVPEKAPGGGHTWMLRPEKSPDNTYTFGNL